MNTIHTTETAYSMLGVEGRMFNKVLDTKTGLFRNQKFSATRTYKAPGFKGGSKITVDVRFDDECGNRHQTFSVTGHVQEPGERDWSLGGCIHEDIAKFFPELAHLIKWHLTSTPGPMHYTSNVCYHASNRDHWGLLKGEASRSPKHQENRILFGDSPVSHKIGERFKKFIEDKLAGDKVFFIRPVEHKKDGIYDFKPKYTFDGYECEWYQCPFDTLAEAQEWQSALSTCQGEFITVPTLFGEGKERQLDAARSAAVWPEATDEQLCAPRAELEAALAERLPALLAAFRADMDSIGMLWEQEPIP